jgi:xanthine dehydrogenase iron-sulfur cluster and FAD-binding subunit A
VKIALAGNLCRCTGYSAIHRSARRSRFCVMISGRR